MVVEYEKKLKEKIAEHDVSLKLLSDLYGDATLINGVQAVPPNISTQELFALHEIELKLAEDVDALRDKLMLSRQN
jgi:hypothetical protein